MGWNHHRCADSGFFGLPYGGDLAIALRDRSQFDKSVHPYVYYFSTAEVPEEHQLKLARVLRFTVCSLSMSQVIEEHIPRRVAPTLFRIRTDKLGWEKTLPAMLKQHYPYNPTRGLAPLVIRADWFVCAAMDQSDSGAYFPLLLGKDIKHIDEFYAAFGMQKKSKYDFGWIEDQSGVARNRTRLIQARPTTARTDIWSTFDVRDLRLTNDPLQHLDRKVVYDASEVIAAIPKVSTHLGKAGSLQAYALSDGEGAIQSKAPADIVVDHTGLRGPEIINGASCVACHVEGLRSPTTNALRQYVQSGAVAAAQRKEVQREVERFYLTDINRLLRRANEDYQTIVKYVTAGWSTQTLSTEFALVYRRYDQALDLEHAAIELRTKAESLKQALAYAPKLNARAAALVHGQSMPRTVFEDEYRTLKQHVDLWEQ